MAGVDYYDLLGVSPQVSAAELKAAYRRLAKTLHPDAGGNAALFRMVTEAYAVLGDPARREQYDAARVAADAPPSSAAAAREGGGSAADGFAGGPFFGRGFPGTGTSAGGIGAPSPGGTFTDDGGAGSAFTDAVANGRAAENAFSDTAFSGEFGDRSFAAGGAPDDEFAADGVERERFADAVSGHAPTRPNVAALSWWDEIDPNRPVLWVPRFGRWRLPFLLSATVWLVLLGLLLAPAIGKHDGPGLLDLTALVPLGYVLVATFGHSPRALTVAAYLWAIGYGGFGVYTMRDSVLTGGWMLILAVGTAGLPPLGKRYLRQRSLDRVFTSEFREFDTFGEPNDGHSGEPDERSGERGGVHGDGPADPADGAPGARDNAGEPHNAADAESDDAGESNAAATDAPNGEDESTTSAADESESDADSPHSARGGPRNGRSATARPAQNGSRDQSAPAAGDGEPFADGADAPDLDEPEIDDDGEFYADGAHGRRAWAGEPEAESAPASEPGNGEARDTPGGPDAVDGSAETTSAAERTAELLAAYLTRLPGVRIFHGLRVPGTGAGELDHAVLCGYRLVLVNSALWEPGNYVIDESGAALREGDRLPTSVPDHARALRSFRNLLPRVEVQSVLLVHPRRPGPLVCSAAVQAPLSMMTPANFVQTIGEWLTETPYTVDRDTFLTVFGQLRG